MQGLKCNFVSKTVVLNGLRMQTEDLCAIFKYAESKMQFYKQKYAFK